MALTKVKSTRRKKDDPFDWDLLDGILQFKPSLSDTATLMKCSEDTIEIFIKRKYGITFSEYRNKRMASVRLTLVQKAIDMAKNGDRTMLIFTLKNLCNWRDNPESEDSESRLEGTLIIKQRQPDKNA